MSFAWFQPMKWARSLTFIALLALDYQHTYEFILSYSHKGQSNDLVPLFGSLFQWAAIPMTNGVFDALAYAFVITAVIFFVSNTLAHRLARKFPSKMYYVALGTGVAISGLTNAGTMFYQATGTQLIPPIAVGWVIAGLGGVVTAGLLMFASMDAWDLKARYEKMMLTREKNRKQREERARKEKFTPRAYRSGESAA